MSSCIPDNYSDTLNTFIDFKINLFQSLEGKG